jgi:hypothetical protein
MPLAFYEVRSSAKPEVYGSPIESGMTKVVPRSGIQMSAANVLRFYDVPSSDRASM